MDKVWVVTYRDRDEDPVVTVFGNPEAAKGCYEAFKITHDAAFLDEVPVYNRFRVS